MLSTWNFLKNNARNKLLPSLETNILFTPQNVYNYQRSPKINRHMQMAWEKTHSHFFHYRIKFENGILEIVHEITGFHLPVFSPLKRRQFCYV